MYFHQKNIQKTSLNCRTHEELGFKYDIHEDFIEFGETINSDAGLVNIDELIDTLNGMRSHGATHVACDFHCDHVELDLCGVEYRLATQSEIDAYENKIKTKEETKKQREIELLEEKLKSLKGEQ